MVMTSVLPKPDNHLGLGNTQIVIRCRSAASRYTHWPLASRPPMDRNVDRDICVDNDYVEAEKGDTGQYGTACKLVR